MYLVHDEFRAPVVRIENLSSSFVTNNHSGITDLATGLCIARSSIEDYLDSLALASHTITSPVTFTNDDPNTRRRSESVVADEPLLAKHLRDCCVERTSIHDAIRTKSRARPCPLALRLHLRVPSGAGRLGDLPAGILKNLFSKITGETVGVVEREQQAAIDGPTLP